MKLLLLLMRFSKRPKQSGRKLIYSNRFDFLLVVVICCHLTRAQKRFERAADDELILTPNVCASLKSLRLSSSALKDASDEFC